MEIFSIILGIVVILVIIAYISSQIRKNQMDEESKTDDKSEEDALFEGIDFDAMKPEEVIPLEVYEVEEDVITEEEPVPGEQQASTQEPQADAAPAKPVFVTDAETSSGQTYEKVLSTEDKREWIANFVSIKRFVAAGWTCMGLGLGFILGRLLGDNVVMVLLIILGGFIGGVFGTNSVGAAMMKVIAAEQSIVNEELLKKILKRLEEK